MQEAPGCHAPQDPYMDLPRSQEGSRLRCGFVLQRFSQYGVIKPNDDGTPRVKVYRDKATQNPKGDGLVTYLYEPSVKPLSSSCRTYDTPSRTLKLNCSFAT